jgi:hypothetical protein
VVQALELAPCGLGPFEAERVALHQRLVAQRTRRRLTELLATLRARATIQWLDRDLAAPPIRLH